MLHTTSDQNIKEAVDFLRRRLESNSVDKKEALRWTLLVEQLLLLYRENDNGSAFDLSCTRRKQRIKIRLKVKATKHEYIHSGDDAIIARLVSELSSLPEQCRRKDCEIVTGDVEIPVPAIWNLRFLMPYLKTVKWSCFAAVFLQCSMIVADVIIPLYTSKLITAYSCSEIRRILILAVVITLCSVFSYSCNYLSVRFFLKVCNSVRNDLETDLSKRVFRLEDACINRFGSGMFIQRIVSDTENLASGFNEITQTLAILIQSIGIIIAVGFISAPLCVIFVFSAVLTSIMEVRRTEKRAQDDRLFRHKRDRYTGFVSEMIRGARDIKLQNSTDVFVNKMSQTIHETNMANNRMEINSARRVLARKVVKEICDLTLYSVMALMILKGQLRPSLAVVILNYNMSTVSFGWRFGTFLNYFNTITVSSERIFQVMFSPEFREEKFGTLNPASFSGNISFQDVSFSYKNDELKTKPRPVLDGVSMDITAGEKIAIVGKSGSGKTTIFNLLTGLYRQDSGRILIDGTELSLFSANFLRSNISAVSQNPYIFNMSVRENLNLAGNNISTVDMDRACKAACIYDDIMAMPDKYDTQLGEGGVTLSGGQRQRLAIARCLLRKTHIILLDEATSALDNKTQENVIHEIGKLFSDCTVITVAHRLSTIVDSDRILFLSNGKIIAQGSHKTLLGSCEKYRTLYQNEF